MDGRELRTTFDGAALLYDEVRPGYPEGVFDEISSLSGVPPGGRVIEVGCGTGQATVPLARRGFEILCIELGQNLAAVARRNLAGYPKVEVKVGNFEKITLPEEAFDLLVSATAFHWLDPAVAYPKAARVLRRGGSLALFWNEHVNTDADKGFFREAEGVYAREAPEIWNGSYEGPPAPEDLPDRAAGIEGPGLFGPVARRSFRWDQPYDTAGYLRVLDTYSGHRSLPEETRSRLYRGLSRLIDGKYGGRIVKGYQTSLYLAPKR